MYSANTVEIKSLAEATEASRRKRGEWWVEERGQCKGTMGKYHYNRMTGADPYTNITYVYKCLFVSGQIEGQNCWKTTTSTTQAKIVTSERGAWLLRVHIMLHRNGLQYWPLMGNKSCFVLFVKSYNLKTTRVRSGWIHNQESQALSSIALDAQGNVAVVFGDISLQNVRARSHHTFEPFPVQLYTFQGAACYNCCRSGSIEKKSNFTWERHEEKELYRRTCCLFYLRLGCNTKPVSKQNKIEERITYFVCCEKCTEVQSRMRHYADFIVSLLIIRDVKPPTDQSLSVHSHQKSLVMTITLGGWTLCNEGNSWFRLQHWYLIPTWGRWREHNVLAKLKKKFTSSQQKASACENVNQTKCQRTFKKLMCMHLAFRIEVTKQQPLLYSERGKLLEMRKPLRPNSGINQLG